LTSLYSAGDFKKLDHRKRSKFDEIKRKGRNKYEGIKKKNQQLSQQNQISSFAAEI